MFEQMFNISPPFHAKLAISLCLCVLESSCYAFIFPFASSCLCVESFHLLFRRQSPLFPPGNDQDDAAAASSPVLAAFVSIWRRSPSFPPIFAPQNSHFSAVFPSCRRHQRRQFSHRYQLRNLL